jgi:hypothetical protein
MPAKKKLIEQVADVMATPSEPPVVSGGTRFVTDADLEADREFVASLDETADALGDGPANMPEPEAAEEPEPVDDVTVDGPDAPQTEATDTAPVRGGVNALVTRLLGDPELAYTDIVAQAVAAFPGAQTSARSVASTASVLRRKGRPVPMRRGPRA